MRKHYEKNTVRYYLLLVFALLFLFFSNDFGVTDVQKTAIVTAAGIDREGDTFILTSQIAIPQSSKQGQSSQSVQLVSRGKTIAEAFEEINAKTGWYPKLVFCDLIILGEKTTEENVFDALDFFLRDEYLSDNCLVATCEGLAKDLLNTSALVDPSSSTAIQKVLSHHAERVGSVFSTTLREFAIGYFGDSQSGFLPVLKTQPQQEKIGNEKNGNSNDSSETDETKSSESGEPPIESSNSGTNNSSKNGQAEEKPVFSAGETALFLRGKRVGTLTKEETFALCATLGKLRLATYTLERQGKTCSLTVKRNDARVKLKTNGKDSFALQIDITLTAGILDYSQAQDLEHIKDAGSVPKEYFTVAEKKLAGTIATAYEKCKAVGCDIFGVQERLSKYGGRRFQEERDTALQNTKIEVQAHFRNIR